MAAIYTKRQHLTIWHYPFKPWRGVVGSDTGFHARGPGFESWLGQSLTKSNNNGEIWRKCVLRPSILIIPVEVSKIVIKRLLLNAYQVRSYINLPNFAIS